ncbi:hypothetical protein [Halochromatium glycolicum]|jgi:predicted nucleic acid-binding protein|uniref:hypothetical protein n=1 Tax=Halochromatium glycolicum TaxID=85075 RepID=UPI00190C4A37|nr:hypothetical protein [Halochromatium glycolicum]
MIVITNASPLIALGQTQRLTILRSLFGRVLMPDTVYQETMMIMMTELNLLWNLR